MLNESMHVNQRFTTMVLLPGEVIIPSEVECRVENFEPKVVVDLSCSASRMN